MSSTFFRRHLEVLGDFIEHLSALLLDQTSQFGLLLIRRGRKKCLPDLPKDMNHLSYGSAKSEPHRMMLWTA